ncbi:mucin-5AC-like [Fundulus heteroclitus]|uniref:mucin-5AC-like n=1 Tax=Fundulus heteroclitus TaxID=8078 RepID=UPI00165B6864|nr:mucin-5AC-like [Fundulus heteroclitus]
MSRKTMTSPSGSSLISTETTTAEQVDTYSTEEKITPSVSFTTEKAGAYPLTTEEEGSSGTISTAQFASTVTVIGTSSTLYSIDTTTATISPEASSTFVSTEEDISDENITTSTETPVTKDTTGSSAFNILSSSVSTSRKADITDTSKTAITSSSALHSTEEPKSVSPKAHQTFTTVGFEEKSPVSEEGSASPITDNERTSQPTRETSSIHIASPTGSSLFSTEKTTAHPPEDLYSIQTGQTMTPSLSTVTARTGSSSASSPVEKSSTGYQTPDTFTTVSVGTGTSSSVHINETRMSPEAIAVLISTEAAGSGEGSTDFTDKTFVTVATASPTLFTGSPSIPTSDTSVKSETSKTTVFTASSDYGEVKSTPVSPETEHVVTTHLFEGSSRAPEQSTSSPLPSVSQGTGKTTISTIDRTGSSSQTQTMYVQTTSVEYEISANPHDEYEELDQKSTVAESVTSTNGSHSELETTAPLIVPTAETSGHTPSDVTEKTTADYTTLSTKICNIRGYLSICQDS